MGEVINLSGLCHESPKFEFGPGSYFDTSNGNFNISVLANHGSAQTHFGHELGFELVFDGGAPSGDNGVFPIDNYLYPDKIAGPLLAKGGHGYTGFSNSGNVSLAGHKSAKIHLLCSSGACVLQGKSWDLGQLKSAPIISDLYNAAPYDSNSAISSSERSITVGFKNSSKNDEATYVGWRIPGYVDDDWHWSDELYIGPDSWSTFTINWDGFTPGTTYTIKVCLWNDAGQTESSIVIRTLHSRPSLYLSHDHSTQSGLEDVTLYWESDKNIKNVSYKIDGGEWISYATGLDARSGTITIYTKNGADLTEDTLYNIKVSVQSTNIYDYRWDAIGDGPYKEVNCRTDMRAYLTDNSPRDITTGNSLYVQKTNESGNPNKIRIYITASEIWWKEETPPGNEYYMTFTQDEWDRAYSKFISPADSSKSAYEHNVIPITYKLVTFGRSREYVSQYNGVILLNGDMLTARTNVGGTIRRGKVWAKPGSDPRRGVTWISIGNGQWRRGI